MLDAPDYLNFEWEGLAIHELCFSEIVIRCRDLCQVEEKENNINVMNWDSD